MRIQNLKKDYSEYTIEDFLHDESFLYSIKNENAETIEFWEKLRNENKLNWETFCSAKDFLNSLADYNEESVSEVELQTIWNNIQTSNKVRKSSTGKLIYKWSWIAAGIIIAMLAIPYFWSKYYLPNVPDITLFAQQNTVYENAEDIQIILSEDKTIKINEKETDIVYDSTEIKFAKNGISKKESAAYNQLIVPKGKRSNLTLSDGTKIVVNAGTRVIYPVDFSQNKKAREIYVNGEVFLDVTHDKSKPFIVKTDIMDIQVLGTKFNVMAYEADQDKHVVLASGAVKISKNGKSGEVILKPSEMYRYNGVQGQVERIDVSYYTSWVDGMYVFESQKLSDVALRLSRYYGVEITCNKDVQNLKCSGKMDLKDNLNDILKGLSFSFPIKIEHDNNKYSFSKKTDSNNLNPL